MDEGTISRLSSEEIAEIDRTFALDEDVKSQTIMRLVSEVRTATDERAALLAGLRLGSSMPVDWNAETHHYDCRGCGAPLARLDHNNDCPWERAMRVLRAHPV